MIKEFVSGGNVAHVCKCRQNDKILGNIIYLFYPLRNVSAPICQCLYGCDHFSLNVKRERHLNEFALALFYPGH